MWPRLPRKNPSKFSRASPRSLDDGAYLNAAYTAYLAQCDANQAQPEPAALWTSKAASAEITKAKGILVNSQMGEAVSKKRHVAGNGSDTQL